MDKPCLQGESESKKNVIEFISNFICALITVRSVNWVEIAQAMEGPALPASKYKKIQRYFRSQTIPESAWADFVFSCFPRKVYRLSLDRTNWQVGRKKINYLVLAVVFKHTAIPVYWKLLPKKGNSNDQERIELLQKFIAYQGVERIDFLTADREFGSREFVNYLLKQKVQFSLRVRNNTVIASGNPTAVGIQAREYLKKMACKQQCILKECFVWGLPVSVVLRREKNDSVVLITNGNPNRALKQYRKRWKIEELFQNLKSRGFHLESTHVTDLERLHKLMGFLTVAYALCYATGEWVNQHERIPMKKHRRLAKSLFRAGLDRFRCALFHFATNPKAMIQLAKMLYRRLTQSNRFPTTGNLATIRAG